jgi:predicted phosphodiesterase
MNRALLLRVPAALLLAGSCTRVAEDRAAGDLRVGHASGAPLDVDVEDGAACVRAIAPGELRLRAQTPSPRFRVRVKDGARTLRVAIDNVLPDATLAIEGGSATLAPGERPRDKIWTVAVPESGVVEGSVHAPDEASRAPYRFALLADVQEAIPDVGDVYAKLNEDPAIRFVLFSGDLTRRGTREQLDRFETRERELRVPLYATLGNHELGDDELHFQQMFGRGSFHFAFRGVDFTLLDSASATIDPRVYGWLDGWLAAGRDHVHVVAMHIPPLDPVGTRNGAFASRSEASKLVATLAAANVDVTLYGHIHSFYAFANGGIPAYISGGGGAVPERLDGIGRNFLVLDVDPGTQAGEGRLLSVGVVRVDLD